MNPQDQIQVLKRGVVDFISEEDLTKRLDKKKKLRVKLGVDPTAPDIHLGHIVVLQKLRQFQDLGHQAVLIIGDGTALIGDPSGTQKTRPQLTENEIKKNSKTYFEQVKSVLDMKKVEIHYNSKWFRKMTFLDGISLASRMTVARMLERDDFSKRYKQGTPICIHELLYPLMQGYDSLMVKADVELGGTDQLFNLLVGRQLQREEGMAPQTIITTPLLEGTDGVQKMSKSYNNYIGVTDSPKDMYGKIMSVSDELMWKYYMLLSGKLEKEIESIRSNAESGGINPRDVKMALALELVTRFHNDAKAKIAAEEFKQVFSSKKDPSDLESTKVKVVSKTYSLIDLIVTVGFSKSNSEARRLITQGAVSIDGSRVSDPHHKVHVTKEILLKVGKRRFKKIKFIH